MNKKNQQSLAAFQMCLADKELAPGSIEKYLRDIRAFLAWAEQRPVTKRLVCTWRESLRSAGYAPSTINSMLVALNQWLKFVGKEECQVKQLRLQRRLFRDTRRELNKEEYQRLVETACGLGKARLGLLMETICATGIRVSEVRYITVEAIRAGRAEIALKGKIRTILIPGKLCRKLEKYARKQKIVSGEIFLTRYGKDLSRRQIWAEMKALAKKAGISASKVFPHNLRHLFARTYYRIYKDVAQLADILGHSSIETTRIYLLSTGSEHQRQLDLLELLC